jgi:predicted small lipoprotein YifL
MKRIVGWLMVMCLMFAVAACGDPDQGPPLGPFAAIAKTETDAPFNITPPTSKSPADFHYTSSNLAVATIAGSLVTIKGAGTSTITAYQDSVGGWGPTSATTTLTVTAVACSGTDVRINGVCTPVQTCVPPAVRANTTQCVPPDSASSAALVHTSSLAWMGVSFSANWTNAGGYCGSTTISGATGDWRLPTTAELKALQASVDLAAQGWQVGYTWSSDMGVNSSAATHVAVDLASGDTVERPDASGAYVTCVR